MRGVEDKRVCLWFKGKNIRNEKASQMGSFFFFLNGSLSSSDETSSPGSHQPDFLPWRSVSGDGRGMTDMLLVTSSVGMVHGVHGHSSNSGPASALCLCLVVGIASLAHG